MDLLERDQDLNQLHDFLHAAIAGQGSLVLLGGEAGVGKTVLVRRFCEEAKPSARLMVGACDPLSTPRPLGPVVDIAYVVGGVLEQLIKSAANRTAVFAAVLAELSRGSKPAVAVFEDIHWADEATLDLLRYLGRRVGTTKALLISTYRDDEVGPNHPLRLVLGDLATTSDVYRHELLPLSVHAVAQLAKGSGIDSTELHRQTGGNPFFVTEVLAAGGGIPPTVRDAVLRRASLLSPSARLVLDAAAVIGPLSSLSLLDQVASPDIESIEACLSGGMLRADAQGLAFRHDLEREAVYDAVWHPRRIVLHSRVMRALEATESADAALLAHHAEAAEDKVAVLKYAPAAARRAVELGATREAVAQYARALRFRDQLPDDERLSLLEAYADASDLSGRGERGIPLREEMVELARRSGDRLKEAEHLGWLAHNLTTGGQFEKAVEAARASMSAIEGLPEGPMHVKLFLLQAYYRYEIRDFVGAVAWCEQANTLAERFKDADGLILTLFRRGCALLVSGDLTGGRADLERCLHMAREAGLDGLVAGALSYLGFGLADYYRFTEAERYLTEAIAHSSDPLRGFATYQSWATVLLARTRFHQGRWNEAAELAESVLDSPELRDALPPLATCDAMLTLGRIQTRQGDSQAWLTFENAAALIRDPSQFPGLAPVQAARAEAAWLAGDRARTITEASSALELARKDHHPWHIGENSYWLWNAEALTEPPLEAAEPFALQIAGDWAGAAKAWNDLGCPYEEARALAVALDV